MKTIFEHHGIEYSHIFLFFRVTPTIDIEPAQLALCQTTVRQTDFQRDFILLNAKEKRPKLQRLRRFLSLVGEDGFEPSKRNATDLQSAPFGHSGILPYQVFQKSKPTA